jgi:carbamoyl-phosphate synthase/aspartate carbamoyltransferase/dihydroorotase
MLKLPGLVDLHVHFRDPGQTHKEDFFSGTAAALAGGYTTVFDMPNNATPITSEVALEEKLASARAKIVCDVGVYFGSLGDNLGEFDRVCDRVCGLKLYLNVTTGGYLLDPAHLVKIFRAWNSPKPVMVHAEDDVIDKVMRVVEATGQLTHVCHVSSRAELEPVLEAKRAGLPVTCGVTPQHLFLTDADAKRLGKFGGVKPALKPQADQDFLWEHLDQIDVVESDHAPHTRAEKEDGTAPFGMPGLETTLPLMLAAEREGRLTRERLVELCSARPMEIQGLAADPETWVEVEPVEFEIGEEGLETKAGWTPFKGMTGVGKVKRVVMRGAVVYEEGRLLAKPGSGRLL